MHGGHSLRAGDHVASLLPPQTPRRVCSEIKAGLQNSHPEAAGTQEALLAVKGQHVLLVSAGEDDGGSQVLREGLEPGHVEGAGAATLPADGQRAAAAARGRVRRSPSGRPAEPRSGLSPSLNPVLICRLFPPKKGHHHILPRCQQDPGQTPWRLPRVFPRIAAPSHRSAGVSVQDLPAQGWGGRREHPEGPFPWGKTRAQGRCWHLHGYERRIP